jgi:Homeodomain-like domain
VVAREIAVKKYVVKLSAEERECLESLIHSGKHPAQKLTKARILLKADASPAGEAWSNSRIASALNTSLATIARTRRQLVEEGFEAVLARKHAPASARQRIFDGAGEAKLIALACSEPPKGRARWTLRLLYGRREAPTVAFLGLAARSRVHEISWSDCEVRPEAGAELRPASGNGLSRCTQKPDIPPGV